MVNQTPIWAWPRVVKMIFNGCFKDCCQHVSQKVGVVLLCTQKESCCWVQQDHARVQASTEEFSARLCTVAISIHHGWLLQAAHDGHQVYIVKACWWLLMSLSLHHNCYELYSQALLCRRFTQLKIGSVLCSMQAPVHSHIEGLVASIQVCNKGVGQSNSISFFSLHVWCIWWIRWRVLLWCNLVTDG
jgi:hypothetical protein